jgi:hypothetical protein
VLGRPAQIGDPDGAGQLGLDPVPRPHELGGAIEQATCAHRVQIVGGQGVESRLQLAHDTSPQFDQMFEV